MTLEFLVRGVRWVDRTPYLDLVETGPRRQHLCPLLGEHIGLSVADGAEFCLGRYVFRAVTNISHLPCPNQAPAMSGGQCQTCSQQDEFRFAHNFHTGGYAPDSLLAYMSQPHWIYIATFADATSKVGTAAQTRKTARLDEQGALAATYIALAENGRLARLLEDELSSSLGLMQVKRRSAKVSALLRPSPLDAIDAAHRETVQRATAHLATAGRQSEIELSDERWTPPSAYGAFLDSRSRATWTPYTHAINAGQHGLYIDACAGTAILARTRQAPDAAPHVIDLASLKGMRIVLGDYASPDTTVQTALF